MTKHEPIDRTITTTLDAATAERIIESAQAQNLSVADYTALALQYLFEQPEGFQRTAAFDAFVQVGLDQADVGELIPHSAVMTDLDAMIAHHRAR